MEPGKVLLWRWELLLVTLRIFDIFKLSDKAIFSEWTEDINIYRERLLIVSWIICKMEFVATLFVMPSPSSPASPPIIKMSILLWCRRAAAARQQGDVANSPKFNMDGAGTGGQMDLNRAEWTE